MQTIDSTMHGTNRPLSYTVVVSPYTNWTIWWMSSDRSLDFGGMPMHGSPHSPRHNGAVTRQPSPGFGGTYCHRARSRYVRDGWWILKVKNRTSLHQLCQCHWVGGGGAAVARCNLCVALKGHLDEDDWYSRGAHPRERMILRDDCCALLLNEQ